MITNLRWNGATKRVWFAVLAFAILLVVISWPNLILPFLYSVTSRELDGIARREAQIIAEAISKTINTTGIAPRTLAELANEPIVAEAVSDRELRGGWERRFLYAPPNTTRTTGETPILFWKSPFAWCDVRFVAHVSGRVEIFSILAGKPMSEFDALIKLEGIAPAAIDGLFRQ